MLTLDVLLQNLATAVAPVAEDISPWLPSLWNFGIWLALGLLVDAVGLRLLLKAAEKTKWQWDNDLIQAFFGKTFLLFLLFGLDTAITLLPSATPLQIIPTMKPVAHQLLVSMSILVSTWLISDIIISFVKYLSNRIEALPSTSIFHNIIRITIICIGVLVILQTLGISILPILTALGVGGLAISLALKDTLENIFAGFQIIFSKQVRLGDYVRMDNGIEGYAEDIGWRNSFIRQPNENLVIIPNAKLAASIITNYSRPSSQMAICAEGVVGYSSDLAAVEKLAFEAANHVIQTQDIANKNREPRLRFVAFTDLGVRFRLYIYVNHHRDEYILLHALIKELHERFVSNRIGFSNIAPADIPIKVLDVPEHASNDHRASDDVEDALVNQQLAKSIVPKLGK